MRFTFLALLLMVSGMAFCQDGNRLPDSVNSLLQRIPHDSTLVVELNRVATESLRVNPAVSRKIASHSSEIARTLKYTRGYARSLTVIGNSYWHEGVFEFAQTYYLAAARQYEVLGDRIGLGQVYNNIGEVNKRLGNYAKALEFLLKSLEHRSSDSTLPISLYNIAEVYLSQKNYAEAERYLERSMTIAKRQNDLRTIYYNTWTTGRIHAAKGLFKEALPYFQTAIDGWKSLGETRVLIQVYQELADEYLKLDRPAIALQYIRSAEELNRKMGITDLRITSYQLRAKAAEATGDHREALHFIGLYNTLRDSVYNLLKLEQLARLQTIYETEMKDREMEKLKADTMLKEQKLKSRESLIVVVLSSLVILGILTVMLFRQRSKILQKNTELQEKNREIREQKESIELQAVTLMKLNEELKNLNKTLESRIEERSTQLLIQNQKLAEYSFVNAHKLRAPVASLLGLLHLLPQATEEDRELILTHLKTCGEQLDTVIHEIGRNLEE